MLIAIHESIPSRPLPSPVNLELITVEINFDCPLLLCIVYLPPNSPPAYFDEVITYLDSIASTSCIILLGNFSLPDICWPSFTGSSPVSKAFCDFAFHHNLIQHVHFPTHCRGGILDLVFSTTEDLVHDLSVFPSDILHSDHLLLPFAIPTVSHPFVEKPSLPLSSFDLKSADLA